MRGCPWTALIRGVLGFLVLGSTAAAQQYVISTFAGGPGAAPAQLAQGVSLGFPVAVTGDSKGGVYFSSASLNSVFRLDANGAITRVAGTGLAGYTGDGGPAASARLSLNAVGIPSPGGLAVDSAGNLFIADILNNCIRRVSPSGFITTVAGTGTQGFSGDGGPAVNAELYLPTGITLDSRGNLFIAERGNNLVRRVSAGGIITTVAGGGTPGYYPGNYFYTGSQGQFVGDGGPATSAVLIGLAGLAVDGNENLYIADFYDNRIRKVSPDGIITTFAGNGAYGTSGDGGPATDAPLALPIGVALDSAGNVFTLQLGYASVREISPSGTMQTIAGGQRQGFSGDGGPATKAAFNNPFAIATDPAGDVYVADTANDRIRKVSLSGTVVTLAGGDQSDQGPIGDGGPATSAQLALPYAVAVDSEGNVIIADAGHSRIRRISPGGVAATLAGTGISGFSGDGGPAVSAQLLQPEALALDRAGNLFVADGGTRVRRISPDGTITTVAGNGTNGFPNGLGDGGPAISASLGGFIAGLAVDQSGNLFISDNNNSRVRRVGLDGIISTVAGGGAALGDGGPATQAQLGAPAGLVFDGGGNLLIADQSGRVRKLTPAGIITTIAGSGVYSGPSGDGGPATSARLSSPSGLALDSAGNLFIADPGADYESGGEGGSDCCEQRIRKVSPDGTITAIAGAGTPGLSGDGGPATTATFDGPVSLALDAAGNVYVADASNNAIRVLRQTERSLLIGAVVDAASQQAGPLSPGKIVIVYGDGLGPAQMIQNHSANGVFGTDLSGTTVAFNGIAAPILYTSAAQIAAVVPYAISGTTAHVTVTYMGQISNDFTVAITPTSPSLFTLNQQGWGQAAAINAANRTVNTAANPLKVGDYISLFATGEGQTSPNGVDGKVASTPASPLLSVTVTIGGIPAQVQYEGSVAGQVAGLMQVNVKIPDGVQPGGYVRVVLTVGDASSSDSVWIAISGN